MEAPAATFNHASQQQAVQANLVDTAARSLRDPIEFLKAAAPRPADDAGD